MLVIEFKSKGYSYCDRSKSLHILCAFRWGDKFAKTLKEGIEAEQDWHISCWVDRAELRCNQELGEQFEEN